MLDPQTVKTIISICNKKPNERQSQEIALLADVTRNCKVFKALIETSGTASHYQCCKYLGYQFCPFSDYLFKYGEKGTKFYIIISGTVGIEIPKKGPNGEEIFIEVTTLNSGSSFGELALESSKPRGASIKCKNDSHFMYLEKYDYVALMSKIVQEKRDSLVNFLQSLPLFMNCTKGTLTKLTYVFRERYFNKGQIVYNEGDPAEDMHIIRKGEFEFFKIIKKAKSSRENCINIKDKCKKSKIANYGVGEMFGEEDSMKGTPRVSTSKCIQNGSVLLSITVNVSDS